MCALSRQVPRSTLVSTGYVRVSTMGNVSISITICHLMLAYHNDNTQQIVWLLQPFC